MWREVGKCVCSPVGRTHLRTAQFATSLELHNSPLHYSCYKEAEEHGNCIAGAQRRQVSKGGLGTDHI